jgi:Caspase domain
MKSLGLSIFYNHVLYRTNIMIHPNEYSLANRILHDIYTRGSFSNTPISTETVRAIRLPPPIKPIVSTKANSGTVSSRHIDAWSWTQVQDGRVSFSFRLTWPERQIRTLKGIIYVILSKSPVRHAEPDKEDRFYTLHRVQGSVTDSIPLLKGTTYYLYVAYSQNIAVPYTFSFTSVPMPVIAPIPVIAPTPVIAPPNPTTLVQPTPKKYAIIIGINDYTYISDLSFCSYDAISWCTYLQKQQYEISLYGDKTSSYTPFTCKGLATEENVRNEIRSISAKLQKGDTFCLIDSSHGGTSDRSSLAFLCMMDLGSYTNDKQKDGYYTDIEMQQDLQKAADTGANLIFFFDACSSGGFMDNVKELDKQRGNVVALSTCSINGYGYDVSSYKHGAWTYYFLVKTLMNEQKPVKNITEAFYQATREYPFKGDDIPQMYGNGSLTF